MQISWWLKRHAGQLLGTILFLGALGVVAFLAFHPQGSSRAIALGNPAASRPTTPPQPTVILSSPTKAQQATTNGEVTTTATAQPQLDLSAIEQETVNAYNCAQKLHGALEFSLDPSLSAAAAKIANGSMSAEALPETVLLRDQLSYDPEGQSAECSVGGNNIAVYPVAQGATKLGVGAARSAAYNLYVIVVLGSE